MKQHFINNAWVAGSSHETIAVLDPSTGLQIEEMTRGNAADIDRVVNASGHGREKGFEALYGFTVLKTVAIRHD